MVQPRVGGIEALLVLIVVVLGVVVWWRVLAKTGYPGALGLLMLIPGVNAVLLLILAFSEWPIEAEVRRLRDRVRE